MRPTLYLATQATTATFLSVCLRKYHVNAYISHMKLLYSVVLQKARKQGMSLLTQVKLKILARDNQ